MNLNTDILQGYIYITSGNLRQSENLTTTDSRNALKPVLAVFEHKIPTDTMQKTKQVKLS